MRSHIILILVSALSATALAQTVQLPGDLSAYPHGQLHSSAGPVQQDYLVGLGALQKIGGKWRHKQSERVSGDLLSYTWQINEAYTSDEAFLWMVESLPESAVLLFECVGRNCGSSAQWASRVFDERVLYGHDERQRYGAWRVQSGGLDTIVVLYASDRANRKHYLRLDILQTQAQGESP
jgi:hypothetical protein